MKRKYCKSKRRTTHSKAVRSIVCYIWPMTVRWVNEMRFLWIMYDAHIQEYKKSSSRELTQSLKFEYAVFHYSFCRFRSDRSGRSILKDTFYLSKNENFWENLPVWWNLKEFFPCCDHRIGSRTVNVPNLFRSLTSRTAKNFLAPNRLAMLNDDFIKLHANPEHFHK